MRIQSGPLKASLEATAAILDAQGLFPPPPPSLGGKTLTELLDSSAVKFRVDPKYPQAIGVGSILAMTTTLGNFEWEVLHNEFADSPFFTSDYPIAIERTDDARIVNKIFPLAPNLALRIKPDVRIDSRRANLSFANFRSRSRGINHAELLDINCTLVRCAEDLVFYRDDRPWVQPFIAKNRHYRIEPDTQKLATPSGTALISTLRVALNILSTGSVVTSAET
jgi:hypothetical protein